MKIKNKAGFHQGVTNGQKKWGDIFEKYMILLAEALETELEREAGEKKKFTAQLVKDTSEKIQKDVLKSYVREMLQKEVYVLLGNTWEYGDLIAFLLEKKKI